MTFNQQQRAYIEGLLRDRGDGRLVTALDSTEEEGLFVKNLENVQGDERDVILFSTAFSVNEKGMLPLNFGPLNRGGGERRLNVAVTRARRQVLVFSSFDPEQLRAEETTSVGIKHLRAYLDLAARGTSSRPAGAHRSVADRHRDQVADALRARGLVVRTDVGLSDFKVDLTAALPEVPERPVLAVLLDGPGWAARRTVGDRDGLPVEVLSRMLEWPAVDRVWLPAWLADPATVVERLVTAAADASSAARSSVPAAASGGTTPARTDAVPRAREATVDDVPSIRSTPTVTRTPARLRNQLVFRRWSTPPLGGREVLDQLPGSAAARLVRAALEHAVEAEGPVHLDRPAKLVAGAFGLSRVSTARMESILGELPAALVPDPAERFAWPTTRRPCEWVEFRRAPDDEPRSVEHVALREIANAMVALSAESAGMHEDELLRETLPSLVAGG